MKTKGKKVFPIISWKATKFVSFRNSIRFHQQFYLVLISISCLLVLSNLKLFRHSIKVSRYINWYHEHSERKKKKREKKQEKVKIDKNFDNQTYRSNIPCCFVHHILRLYLSQASHQAFYVYVDWIILLLSCNHDIFKLR